MTKKQKIKKVVLFEEVNAETRNWHFDDVYKIIEYPTKSNKWYILRCQPCDKNLRTVYGASKHLTGKKHGGDGNLDRVVDELGTQVIGCGKDEARRNNAAFIEAFKEGFCNEGEQERFGLRTLEAIQHEQFTTNLGKQHGEYDLSEDEPDPNAIGIVSSAEEVPEAIHNGPQTEPFWSVADPVAGKLYQAYWEEIADEDLVL